MADGAAGEAGGVDPEGALPPAEVLQCYTGCKHWGMLRSEVQQRVLQGATQDATGVLRTVIMLLRMPEG